MTSASLLLCGRRTRRTRPAAGSDAGASASSSGAARPFHSSRSSSAAAGGGGAESGRGRQRGSRRGADSRNDGEVVGGIDTASQYLRRCYGSDLSGDNISLHVDGGVGESPLGSVINPSTIRNNYGGGGRLPRAVLLARERLLDRLGVSVYGARQGREEASRGLPRSEVWLVDAGDWETSISTESLPGSTSLVESSLEADALPLVHEREKKPPGLTMDSFTLLPRNVFSGVECNNGHPQSRELNDCSICLESFVEGNRLTTLPCNHRFHSSCLYPWVETCGECPYCRAAINPRKY